jgi:frataxin-like iron-binding protein CyaY
MITLVFSNGSQIVVNLQKPLHESLARSPQPGAFTTSFDGAAVGGHQRQR